MATTKLILLQDVEDLGLAGDEVRVTAGYARNFLVPRGLASEASTATLRRLAANKEKIEAKRKADMEAANALAEKINTTELVIPMQASDDSHLFGSVNERVICGALQEQLQITVQPHKIKLGSQIRTLGNFTVEVHIRQGIIATAKLNVTRA